MRGLGYYAGAVLATMKRDAVIFFSYRFRIVGQILAMFLTLTIFYYIGKLVRPDAVGPRGQYFAFVVVGIVTAGVLTSALSTSQLVRLELVAGNFERVLISPLGPVWGVISVAAFPICYSTVFSGAMLGLAVLLFDVPIHVAGIGPAMGVAVLGALCLACIGLLFVAGVLALSPHWGRPG